MTKKLKDSEVSTYMMCQALAGPLAEIEEVILPSLEAIGKDLQKVCEESYDILGTLERRIEKLEPGE